jgi:hypothetical protein
MYRSIIFAYCIGVAVTLFLGQCVREEEEGVRILENKVVRRIFGAECKEVRGD